MHDAAISLRRRTAGAVAITLAALACAAPAAHADSIAHVRNGNERLEGVEALTPAERRVAQIAAEGLTNRQIAETLWVTLKTVEVHLGRSYGKLGIGSRRELAGALGLDDDARAA